ncbi:hypothetical protein [Caballeronia sp. BR00000012568055]|uniref:hypothetical protein n=1 Tax=Caballeronia sp. BR00000012568055 TaxID=2918761 RepID=UPI0023F824BB|nr:hypothetical protein [Caballeronia sp. BR00000012568055]
MDDDLEEKLRLQQSRIDQLEQENVALKEINGILQKAVAYYSSTSTSASETRFGQSANA